MADDTDSDNLYLVPCNVKYEFRIDLACLFVCKKLHAEEYHKIVVPFHGYNKGVYRCLRNVPLYYNVINCTISMVLLSLRATKRLMF